MKRRLVVGLGVALFIVGTAILAFLVGEKNVNGGLSIRRVTATEIANAMENDRFFSEYGRSTLVVDGTVSSLRIDGAHLVATFTTNSSFQVWCDLGAPPSKARAGDRVAAVTEGPRAERQGSGVFLHDCVLP